MRFKGEIIKTLIESSARGFMICLMMGMIWTVYSNHNPVALEHIWVFRIITIIWVIWVIIPFFETYKKIEGNSARISETEDKDG